MIAWKAVARYESDRALEEAALDGCLFLEEETKTRIFELQKNSGYHLADEESPTERGQG
jgi:hypothetical protein